LPLEVVYRHKAAATWQTCAPPKDEILKPQRGPSINCSYLQKLHRPDSATSYKREAHLSDGCSFLARPNVAHSEERVQRGHQCPTQVRFQRRRSFGTGEAYFGPAARSGIQGHRTRCSDGQSSNCQRIKRWNAIDKVKTASATRRRTPAAVIAAGQE
jgi:hypothetical protein